MKINELYVYLQFYHFHGRKKNRDEPQKLTNGFDFLDFT